MMKYSTYTWDLMRAPESASPASCKTPAICIDFICQNNQPGKSKKSRNEVQFPTYCTVLSYVGHGLWVSPPKLSHSALSN